MTVCKYSWLIRLYPAFSRRHKQTEQPNNTMACLGSGLACYWGSNSADNGLHTRNSFLFAHYSVVLCLDLAMSFKQCSLSWEAWLLWLSEVWRLMCLLEKRGLISILYCICSQAQWVSGCLFVSFLFSKANFNPSPPVLFNNRFCYLIWLFRRGTGFSATLVLH